MKYDYEPIVILPLKPYVIERNGMVIGRITAASGDIAFDMKNRLFPLDSKVRAASDTQYIAAPIAS